MLIHVSNTPQQVAVDYQAEQAEKVEQTEQAEQARHFINLINLKFPQFSNTVSKIIKHIYTLEFITSNIYFWIYRNHLHFETFDFIATYWIAHIYRKHIEIYLEPHSKFDREHLSVRQMRDHL